MVIYNVIIGICFAILTVELLYLVISWLVKDRVGRIAFLRSYKKGKCVIIYFSALPLFFIGYLYSGVGFFEAVFGTLNEVFNLIVLKYSTAGYQALFDASLFYRITVYYCYTLVGFNALLFTLSLTSQRLWQFGQAVKARFTKKERLFIFGYNDDNLSIWRSAKEYSSLIVDKVGAEECNLMYSQKTFYCRDERLAIDKIFTYVRQKNAKCTVVINTGDDEHNIKLCQKFLSKLNSSELFNHIRIYVFGEPQHEAIYEDIMASASGCVHYKNKYRIIAMNFVDRYPISKFLDKRYVDYDTSFVADDVKLNVCLVGFGKVNQQIFMTSVANNQFLTERDGEATLKKVKYHIFDKVDAENNKNLNHTYYRFRNECVPGRYLPLPSQPADEEYHHMDVNDPEFYTVIREISSQPNSVNLIVVSYDTDLENLDMAHRLVAKKREWGLKDTYIFVRSVIHRDSAVLGEQNDCFMIGDEEHDVYNIDEITGDRIFKMAQMRNEIYDLEYKLTHQPGLEVDRQLIENNKEESDRRWFVSKNQMERESSLYCCLSLRSKLNLIGLDYCDASDSRTGLSEAQFADIYFKDDAPKYYDLTADGKKIIDYPLFFKQSLRKNLAVLEHYRWNSFMISKGFVPSTIDEIESEKTNDNKNFTNGKNYALRRHGNLTTFDGLAEFRKLVADRDHCSEEQTDVIKYDYQLMDDAYWLLGSCGLKIVKRETK